MSAADAGKHLPEASPPPDTAEQRQKLRRKWELASVLNFLHVFEPVMKTKLKLSAEDIETGLIEFNGSLSQLHIVLLKGITSSKFLDGSEAWVITLSRVLQSWWPWVAEGDFPLKTSKGGELSRYKELDPTVRLLILKALCEVRAIQDDIVSFINETTKDDTAISTFRKEKLADEKGTVYWYDGDAIIGHRLYREVCQLDDKMMFRGKELSDIYSQWETVATNLEEFHLVKDELASSDIRSEVSVTKTIEVEVIPALEKLQKKKEKALKQLEKKNVLACAFQSSRLTRSSRNSKPISYTYDAYDKAIKEAIHVTETRKIGDKPRSGKQTTALTEGPLEVLDSPQGTSTENDADTDGNLGGSDVEDGSDDEYKNENEEEIRDEEIRDEDIDDMSDSDEQTNLTTRGQTGCAIHIPRGSRFSSRLTRTADDGALESININAKNRSRQRPSVNTAFECSVTDSEDENLSNSSKYFVPDSEDENSGNSNSSSKRIRT